MSPDAALPRAEPETTPAGSLQLGWSDSERVLAELFEIPVILSEPIVRTVDGFVAAVHEPATESDTTVVVMRFQAASEQGLAALLLPRSSARSLAAHLMGADDPYDAEVLALVPAAAVEMGNIVMNAILARVGASAGVHYHYEVPSIRSAARLASAIEAAGTTWLMQGSIRVGQAPPAPLGVLVHRAQRSESAENSRPGTGGRN